MADTRRLLELKILRFALNDVIRVSGFELRALSFSSTYRRIRDDLILGIVLLKQKRGSLPENRAWAGPDSYRANLSPVHWLDFSLLRFFSSMEKK